MRNALLIIFSAFVLNLNATITQETQFEMTKVNVSEENVPVWGFLNNEGDVLTVELERSVLENFDIEEDCILELLDELIPSYHIYDQNNVNTETFSSASHYILPLGFNDKREIVGATISSIHFEAIHGTATDWVFPRSDENSSIVQAQNNLGDAIGTFERDGRRVIFLHSITQGVQELYEMTDENIGSESMWINDRGTVIIEFSEYKGEDFYHIYLDGELIVFDGANPIQALNNNDQLLMEVYEADQSPFIYDLKTGKRTEIPLRGDWIDVEYFNDNGEVLGTCEEDESSYFFIWSEQAGYVPFEFDLALFGLNNKGQILAGDPETDELLLISPK